MTALDRHRLEIEFDSDVSWAEWLEMWVRISTSNRADYFSNVTIGMTR